MRIIMKNLPAFVSIVLLVSLCELCGCDLPGDNTTARPPSVPHVDDDDEALKPSVDSGQPKQKFPVWNPETRTFRSPAIGVTFRLPDGWEPQELPPQLIGIHEAKFQRSEDGAFAEMTFSATGGGLELNVNRWRGQVTSPPGEPREESDVEVGGFNGKKLDLTGAYSGSGRGDRQKYRVISVALSVQPQNLYIKLLGPREEIGRLAKGFDEMLETAQAPR